MQHPTITKDTAAWRFQVWVSFLISLASVSFAILFLPVDTWIRSFLGMGLFFLISTSFTLAKTIRDNQEADKFVNRISEAKAEKILRQYEDV